LGLKKEIMLKQVITYTSSKSTLGQWFEENMPEHIYYADEENQKDPKIKAQKTPTYANGEHSVSHLIVDSLDWIEQSPLEILAACDKGQDPFALIDKAEEEKIRLAYPEIIQDSKGNETARGIKFCVFV